MTANQLTGIYQARLAGSTGQAAGAVRAAFDAGLSPGNPASLAGVAVTSATITAAAQAGATAETLAYLRALTADTTRAGLGSVAPYAAPSGVIGFAASGQPLHELTGLAPAVYRARLNQGWTDADSAAAAAAWLDSVVNSEAYRAANRTVLDNAIADDRLTGRVGRVTHAGACPFCELIADRGYTEAAAGFAAHRRCRCTGSPEIRGHPARRLHPELPGPRGSMAGWSDAELAELDGLVPGSGEYSGARGDPALARIRQLQGMDGLPVRGDPDAAEGLPVWRGNAEAAYRDNWLYSADPRAGLGIYGNGDYFAGSVRGARSWHPDMANMIEGRLAANAKTINYRDLQAMMSRTPSLPGAGKLVTADPGRYAAMLGYDAILITGGSGAVQEVVVLNRAKIVFRR